MENILESQNEVISYEHTRNFPIWLMNQKCSLLISTYKKHRLFCLGMSQNGSLTLVFTNLMRPMGIYYDTQSSTIYSSNVGNIVQYENRGQENHAEWGVFDALFMPKRIDYCGDMDIHDLRVGEKIYYVSAVYNSILTTSAHNSFEVYWTPSFISKNIKGQPPREDRCHLNGMCLVNGKPKYATAACTRDYYYAWKEHHGEGVVIDVETDEFVASGLWAPHSPIWHEGRLYIGEAGTGQFGYVDLEKKVFVPCKFLPGFIRGITCFRRFAIVTISNDRHDNVFDDIPLGRLLKEKGQRSFCGICVIDLDTFDILHHFQFSSGMTEIYDITVLPNIIRPRIAEMHETEGEQFYF